MVRYLTLMVEMYQWCLKMLQALYLKYNSKIQKPSPSQLIFYICLFIFRVTWSLMSIPQFIGQTVSQTKRSWHFKQGKCLLFQAEHILFLPLSNTWVQGHYITLWTNKLSHTHKQAQTQYFAFSHTYSVTHTNTQYTHTCTSNLSKLFWQQSAVSYWTVFCFDKQVVHHPQHNHWA